MSDGDLVRRALSGQTGAYEELVRRWAGRITALCHAKTARRAAADDLAQETLLRGFRSLGSLHNPEKFGAWLYGIARRTCRDHLKAKQNSQVTFTDLDPGHDPDQISEGRMPPQEMDSNRAEQMDRLMAEVERLPEAYREVLMLFYYEDLKYRDIARLLGISSATVNARLTRARAMLRERCSQSSR